MAIYKPPKLFKCDSTFIKNRLLEYFRYNRGYYLVCTECINNADINAMNSKHLVEVEIKTGLNDLKNEFNSEKCSRMKFKKHFKMYGSPTRFPAQVIPNYFYLCVTPNLQEEAIKCIEEVNSNYGLFICYDHKFGGDFLHLVRQAKKLHDLPHKEKTRDRIIRRITSDLIINRRRLETAAQEEWEKQQPPINEMKRPEIDI